MVEGRGEDFAENYASVEAAAETGLADTENPMAGISIWKRAVLIQGRLTALAIQWHRTKDRRYLEAALANVDGIPTTNGAGPATGCVPRLLAGPG